MAMPHDGNEKEKLHVSIHIYVPSKKFHNQINWIKIASLYEHTFLQTNLCERYVRKTATNYMDAHLARFIY